MNYKVSLRCKLCICYKLLSVLMIVVLTSVKIISAKCSNELSTKIIIQPDWTSEAVEILDGRKELYFYLETENEEYSIDYDGERYDFESQGFAGGEEQFVDNLMEKVNSEINLSFKRSSREDADFIITKTCVPNDSTYGIVQMSWDETEYIMALNSCRPIFEKRPEAAFLHELGHVMGLEHPFDDGDGDCYRTTDGFSNKAATMSQTLMAYRGSEKAPRFYTELDLAAIAEVYGRKKKKKEVAIRSKQNRVKNINTNSLGVWDSTYGKINVVSDEKGIINANYKNGGFIVLKEIINNFYSGYWVEDKRGSCTNTVLNERTKNRSNYWGRFELTFKSDSFEGNWSYCDTQPEKVWNGTLNRKSVQQNEPTKTVQKAKSDSIIQSWNSSYGKIDVISNDRGIIKALYSSSGSGQGFIILENTGENFYSGYWIGYVGSGCEEKKFNERIGKNTNYWGRFALEFLGDQFKGKWSYCEDTPSSGWNGSLIKDSIK